MKNDIKLYNVLFPLWLILAIPPISLGVIIFNFLFDSLILLIGMKKYNIAEKGKFYKKHILKIVLFGFLADIIGSIYMFVLMYFFRIGSMGDELYLTIQGFIISVVLIFVFNYYITFKKDMLRLELSLLFATFTAPYTFFIPSSLLYG